MGKLTRTKGQIVRDRLLAAMAVVGIVLGVVGVLIAIAFGLAALANLGLVWPWIVLGVVVLILAVFLVYKQMEANEGGTEISGWDDE